MADFLALWTVASMAWLLDLASGFTAEECNRRGVAAARNREAARSGAS